MKKILSALVAVMLIVSISFTYFDIAHAQDSGNATDIQEAEDAGADTRMKDGESIDKTINTGNKTDIKEESQYVATPMLRAPQQSEVIKISSLEDLKAYLEYKKVKKTIHDTEPVERFVLKGGNYEIVSSFEIDLGDSYFSGKEDAIKYGLISTEDDFSIKGNGNTISFKQDEAVALFGMVDSHKYEIDGLKIAYPKDVFGFAFAQKLQSKDDGTGKAIANGVIKNIDISVGGDVKPLKVIGNEKYSNHFIGQYSGVISTGFSWYINSTNIENININIVGNIGSTTRPDEEKDMVAAYGLTHHFDNVPYTDTYNAETWKELHDRGNPEVLKDAGHIIGLNLNVGGNIQAYGNNTGYSAGVGQDMASAWMERINIKIDGNIITDLDGNTTPIIQSYTSPYAFGFSDEVMNLTDSSLKVGNIIFISNNLPESSDITLVGAVANNNSKGNYINIKNNTIEVEGKIEGKSNQNLLASIGFGNDWNSSGKNGTNWIQESEHNTYYVGEVNLESDKIVVFNALGKKWRTGKEPLGSYVLPEASLKNEKVTTGDITITAGERASVSLLMNNASNAKNNTLDYGNIVIKANKTNFYGMGNLQNDRPKENFYENITENNNITMKDLTIETNDAQYISLMAGFQDAEQQLKNNTVKADNVIIKLNSSQNTYISGIAGYSLSPIDSCRVFLGSIHVENSGDKNVYFGLGAARTDKSIKNSGVFVDGNIEIESKRLYGGGFIGFAKNSTIEGNDFQVDGTNKIGLNNGTYGGFAGWLADSTLKNNSSLILNDFMPFAGYANGGILENISHYVNGKAPQYFSGLITGGKNNPKIINSTLLVEKKFADTILYRNDSVSTDSGNNYLVVVDDDSEYNRLAYKIAKTVSTKEEMGTEIPVLKKTGEPIGKINIKARTFQDKYWNTGIGSYEIGNAEKNFDYMTKNAAGKVSVFGVDSDKIVTGEGAIGNLYDYYHRHAGLAGDSGVVYDLLGIKGSLKFRVIYDGNGADKGSIPEDKHEYKSNDKVTVLSNGSLSRTKHEFVGWNTKADGSGTNYKVGDHFKITEDTTLYAVWKKVPNIVTFKNNNDEYAKVKVENGKDIDNDGLTDESMPQNPTKSGYTFKEWNTQEDGKGTAFTGTTVVNKDMTVYAIYSKNAGIINSAPTLEVEDKTIEQGTDLDLKTLIKSATDKEDGDLKDKVAIIDNGGFDKEKAGKYTVTFKVTDKDGASATKKAVVTVNPKAMDMNVAPKLEVEDKTIEQGTDLDLKTLIKSATDKEDGDLKDKVSIVDDGGFSKDKVGKYTVTFKIRDSKGASSTKKAVVTVNPKAMDMNVAPKLEVEDKTIEQGTDLDLKTLIKSATDKEDGDLKDKVSIVDDGGFDKEKAGKYTVTFKVTDKDGASATKKATVTVVEKDKPTPSPHDNKPKPNPDNNKPQTLNNMTLPKTGDSSNLALYGTLMGLSGLLLIAVGIRKRRKES